MDSLWVRIKGRANIGDTVVGVCYRPPDQEEEVDEAFYKQLEVALPPPHSFLWGTSTILILVGKVTKPGTQGPGSSCSVLVITF